VLKYAAIRQFEAALPQLAMLSFEQDNFTVTQMNYLWFCVGQRVERVEWFYS